MMWNLSSISSEIHTPSIEKKSVSNFTSFMKIIDFFFCTKLFHSVYSIEGKDYEILMSYVPYEKVKGDECLFLS